MRKLFAVLCLLPLAALPLLAQTRTGGYTWTRCIKVGPNQGGEYRQLQMETTAKAMEIRVQEGDVDGWIFASAFIPSGADTDCDFLLVNIHNGFPPEGQSIQPFFDKAGVTINRAKWYERLGAVSRLSSIQLWRNILDIGSVEAGNILRIDNLKLTRHKTADWTALQNEAWRPAAEAKVRDGSLKSWQAQSIFMPVGTGLEFNARVISVYADWAAVGKPVGFREAMQKAHPGKNVDEIFSRVSELQENVKSQLFNVIAVVGPKK